MLQKFLITVYFYRVLTWRNLPSFGFSENRFLCRVVPQNIIRNRHVFQDHFNLSLAITWFVLDGKHSHVNNSSTHFRIFFCLTISNIPPSNNDRGEGGIYSLRRDMHTRIPEQGALWGKGGPLIKHKITTEIRIRSSLLSQNLDTKLGIEWPTLRTKWEASSLSNSHFQVNYRFMRIIDLTTPPPQLSQRTIH